MHLRLLAQRFELVLVGFERETYLVVVSNDVGTYERRGADIGRLIERNLLLLRSDVA